MLLQITMMSPDRLAAGYHGPAPKRGAAMEEALNGFQITAPDGRILHGAVAVTEYGVFEDQEEAINAGWTIRVRSIVARADGLSITIDA
jgi:hypothetical protein